MSEVFGIEQAYFLRELTTRQLSKVKGIAGTRHLAADEVIVAVGGEVRSLYVVGRGQVRVLVPIEGEEGVEEEVLGRMGPGECFGEFSFADRGPASASVAADEESTIHVLPFDELDALIASDPDMALKLFGAMFRTVVARLRSTDADSAMARYVLRYV